MAFMDQAGNVRPVTLNPDGSVPVADASPDDPLGEVARLLAEILDEQRATRLALEDFVNAGREEQVNYLEQARAARGVSEYEEG